MSPKRTKANTETPGNSSNVRRFLSKLDAALIDMVSAEGFAPELFIAPGVPRIRPLLVMLSAKATAQEPVSDEDIEHAALAAELLAGAILVHDAALGRQGGRRRRVARRLLGAVGWLGGNTLTLRALELTQQIPAPGVIHELLEALREIGDSHRNSQQWPTPMPPIQDCLLHIEQRSGAVFSFACRAGGRLVGAKRPHLTRLGRFGFHLGVAWSLAEELQLFSLPPSDAVGAIIERADNGRPPYPLSLASERNTVLVGLWSDLRQNGSESAAKELYSLVKEGDSLAKTRAKVAQSVWSAQSTLRQLPPSQHRDAMEALAKTLLTV